MLKPGGQAEGDAALEFYAKHTAQIEVTQPARAQACAGPTRAPAVYQGLPSGLNVW